MSIEKMVMLNVFSKFDDFNEITEKLILLDTVHFVNAMNEVDDSDFTLEIKEENIEELIEIGNIKPYEILPQYKNEIEGLRKDVIELSKMISMDMEPEIDNNIEKESLNNTIKFIREINSKIQPFYTTSENNKRELEKLEKLHSNLSHLVDLDINFEEINRLNYFGYKLGTLTNENRLKLKKNYENVSAIVLHIGSEDKEEVYLVFYPKDLEIETERILRSLYFKEFDIPKDIVGKPSNTLGLLDFHIKSINKDIVKSNENYDNAKQKYAKRAKECMQRLLIEEKKLSLMEQIACTQNFFYLSGWVPSSKKEEIETTLDGSSDDMTIIFKEVNDVSSFIKPPTKLRNNKMFKPFENLVLMYGLPTYGEIDPTFFLGITYMLMFGAMFGDVGQGFVLFISGYVFTKKGIGGAMSKIITRVGISSMIFGMLYGSIFGFEDILPALLIRPIHNINIILIASVIFGIVLLLISYVLSIINKINKKNYEEGILGRNGIVGLFYYILFLFLLLNVATNKIYIPTDVLVGLLGLLTLLIIVREPLMNFILKKRPLHKENISTYYVESGFTILETLLNMLSSTISFIRIGAFALNHVGLFIAFQTVANMMGNAFGSLYVYIIGNVIIIGLEGLVVFIQGMRLEYYELFSKYYSGEGIEFKTNK